MEQEVKKKKKKVTEDNVAKSINKNTEVKKNKKVKNSPLVPILCLIIGILLGVLGTILVMDKTSSGLTESVEDKNSIEEMVDENKMVDTKSSLEEMLEGEAFVIETPNCDLYYPLEWKEQIRVEQVEGDVHIVKFFGTIGEQGEHFLFSVLFGGEEGVLLGTLNEKPVYIISTTEEATETWTEDEEMTFLNMQVDVNYLLGMLQKEEGFVKAEQ